MLEGKRIYPCFRNVLVRLEQRAEKEGSIYLPEVAQRANVWGTVVARGPDALSVDEEDKVYVARIDGTHFIVAKVEYVMVDERKLLAVERAGVNPVP